MVRLLRRGLDGLLALGGIALLVLVVAVSAGQLRWVVTTGNSMEPHFTAGDLVLLRPTSDYDVGDVVGYDSPHLGRMVLHRIIDVEDGRFLTKGDNNDWVDSHRPTAAEIAGRQGLHVPGAGRVVRSLFDPLVVAFLVGVATALALGGVARIGAPREAEAWAEPAV